MSEWRSRAACRGMDTNVFFPDPDGLNFEAQREMWDSVKRICTDCPVRQECMEYSFTLNRRERFGVWGGLTYLERHPRSDIAHDRLRIHRTADAVFKATGVRVSDILSHCRDERAVEARKVLWAQLVASGMAVNRVASLTGFDHKTVAYGLERVDRELLAESEAV